MKNQCKNSSSFCIDFSLKIKTFSGSKAASILGCIFAGKWLQKGNQKSYFFHEKWPSGPPRVDLFCFLRGLGRVRKKVNCSIPPKIDPDRPLFKNGSPPQNEDTTFVAYKAPKIKAPRPGANYQRNTREKGLNIRKKILTRLWAFGPANLKANASCRRPQQLKIQKIQNMLKFISSNIHYFRRFQPEWISDSNSA